MDAATPITDAAASDTIVVLDSGHATERVAGDNKNFATYADDDMLSLARTHAYSPHTDYIVTTQGVNGAYPVTYHTLGLGPPIECVNAHSEDCWRQVTAQAASRERPAVTVPDMPVGIGTKSSVSHHDSWQPVLRLIQL